MIGCFEPQPTLEKPRLWACLGLGTSLCEYPECCDKTHSPPGLPPGLLSAWGQLGGCRRGGFPRGSVGEDGCCQMICSGPTGSIRGRYRKREVMLGTLHLLLAWQDRSFITMVTREVISSLFFVTVFRGQNQNFNPLPTSTAFPSFPYLSRVAPLSPCFLVSENTVAICQHPRHWPMPSLLANAKRMSGTCVLGTQLGGRQIPRWVRGKMQRRSCPHYWAASWLGLCQAKKCLR